MNYKKIYDSVIEKAVERKEPNESYDKHHIIPRSLGGSDDLINIVKLTLREHFVCHLLLAKIYGKGMLHAALMLSSFRRYNSRLYKWLRDRYIQDCMIGDNNPARRFPCTEEKRRKNSLTSKGRRWINNGEQNKMIQDQELLNKLLTDGWSYGRLMTDTLKEGTKKGGQKTGGHNKGKGMSDEQKVKCSETWFKKGKPNDGI